MKICLLIYRLDLGGAQRQIVALARALADAGHEVCLMTCYDGGEFLTEIQNDEKVRHVSLHKKGRWEIAAFLWRFFYHLRRLRPDVLYGFLSLANLLSVLAKTIMPQMKVIFGVRASNVNLKNYGFILRTVSGMECFLSQFADAVIANSETGKTYHEKLFSFDREIRVVPNGIDTDVFRPDTEKRIAQRVVWNYSGDHFVIGIAGRMDPMKGWPVFVRAAAMALNKNPQMRFVCLGDGSEKDVAEIEALSGELGVRDRLIRPGVSPDMTGFYNGIDVYTSASIFGEGFSNTVGEAMACGVPCVVTNVGDSPYIVGDCGIVVSPEDPEALAAAWEEIYKTGTETYGTLCRKRVTENFSVRQMRKQTEAVLTNVLEGRR